MEWKNVIYGPVKSRRLGQSLGINLSPIELKVCNFSCGYCRVGVPSKGTIKREEWRELGYGIENAREAIKIGLEHHAKKGTLIDYITLAGNGEPTLYPWFSEIVDYLILIKELYLPAKPTAIFTNATKISQKEIKEAILKLDRRFFKLDAGDEKTFRRINLPNRVAYSKIIQNLLSSDGYELSIAVTNDDVPNYNSFFNNEFIEKLKKMKFTKLFLYDIDIPRTISPKFNKKTEKERLEHLASYFSEHLCRKIGEDIIILWDSNTRESNLPLYPKQINCIESYGKDQIPQE